MRKSLNLIDAMGEVLNVTGSAVRGSGWYGPTSGLHSVGIRTLNFQGRISIQATLAIDPSDSDWFSVMPDAVPYWQYPRLGYVVTDVAYSGETSNVGFNFSCNAVWVRAIVDRSYMATAFETPCQFSYLGIVDSILLNY